MMYIKLKDDMSLVVTVRQPLYRGDNLNRKVTYLIPAQVGEIDIQTACLYLSYIRADGAADVAMLERMDEMYNDEYYQYTFPVTCKLTKYAGPVCSWLQIYAGDPSNPEISKSDECILQIQESKDMDDYLSDTQITALYQMQYRIGNPADGLSYNADTRELQLKSGDDKIGNIIIVPADSYAGGDSEDGGTTEDGEEWEDMNSSGEDSSTGTETWEPM